jgi:hypothetical protein
MKQLYGTAFVTVYGPTPSPVWEAKIAELTDAECAAGFSRLAEQKRDFPANLTEFVDACRPKSAGVRFLGRPVDMNQLRLPRPKARPEVVKAHLDSMRKLFKK